MAETTIGQIIIFVSVVAGYIYNIYRENRNRRWDLEDRKQTAANLAAQVKISENKLATATQTNQDQIMIKIAQNTAITKQIHQKAEDTKLTVQAIIAQYDAIAKREPIEPEDKKA